MIPAATIYTLLASIPAAKKDSFVRRIFNQLGTSALFSTPNFPPLVRSLRLWRVA